MNYHFLLPIAFFGPLLLSACATPTDYPSLTVRDSERISGSMEVPDAPSFTPAPPSAATIEQLSTLSENARAAHNRFLTAANAAREPVLSAAESELGSTSWSEAQVAIARLESIRSDAMIALADIDSLFSEAALRGDDLAQLEAARAEISAMVDDENRLISAMLGSLSS